MLEDKMDVVIWLKYLIKLQNIRMPDFPQQVDLIVETKHRFNIILKHRFADGLESEFASFTHVGDLVDFREIPFSNKIADLILGT